MQNGTYKALCLAEVEHVTRILGDRTFWDDHSIITYMTRCFVHGLCMALESMRKNCGHSTTALRVGITSTSASLTHGFTHWDSARGVSITSQASS